MSDTYCSPHHVLPFDSRGEGLKSGGRRGRHYMSDRYCSPNNVLPFDSRSESYNLEDDVVGIICQALHHGLLLEVVSAEYLQVPAAAVGDCVGRHCGGFTGMD
jgi:hypothetical protein